MAAKDTDFKRIRRASEVYKQLGYKASDFEGKTDAETQSMINKALELARYRRIDADIISDRGISIVLGSKQYEVKQRTIDDEGAWCERCGIVAGEIVELLFDKAGPEIAKLNLDGALMAQNPTAVVNQIAPILRRLLPTVIPYLFGKFLKDFTAMFFEYSGIDREEAKGNGATHMQVFNASVAVFNAYILPFMVGMVKAMWSGVLATGIMPLE